MRRVLGRAASRNPSTVHHLLTAIWQVVEGVIDDAVTAISLSARVDGNYLRMQCWRRTGQSKPSPKALETNSAAPS